MSPNKAIFRFIVIGFSTVAIDYILYSFLVNVGIERTYGKGLGFMSGVVYSFLLNKNWTFEFKGSTSGSATRYIALYGLTLAINVGVNDYIIALVASTGANGHALSFVLATAISAIANFLGMRYYVFNPTRK